MATGFIGAMATGFDNSEAHKDNIATNIIILITDYLFHFLSMIPEGASASVLASNWMHFPQLLEQRRLKRSFQAGFDHITVAEWREGTGLSIIITTIFNMSS